jgi:hypothetical protein
MRRLSAVVIAIVALAAPGTASAQVQWAVKGGYVAASIATDDAVEIDSDPGGALGGSIALDLGRGVRFEPEILFTTRRFSSSGVAVPFAVSARAIEIPLLFHVGFPQGRTVRALLSAGPLVGVITNVTQIENSIESDVSDNVERIDAGIAVGGGVEISAGRGVLVIEVRSSIGLRQLNKTADPELKSRALFTLIGVRF